MDKAREQPIEDKLTSRELEILRLVADGLTNKAIGERLFIGFETVKWYLKQIYSKLDVTNRIQAIDLARAAGLLTGTWGSSEPPAQKHNLPYQPTPFVGRIEELGQLAERLENPKCRLLTVVGPGGVGKTRLALEAAAAQLIRFRDGVYFTALAPLFDSDLMPTVIAEAVHLSFAPGQPAKNQLLTHLHDKQMLLVLDNFEHLLAGASLLTELIDSALGVKLLVTSRERLQLQSEVVFRLDGFPLASWKTPQEAAESSAGKLFLQSAQRVKASFELTQDTMSPLNSICHMVSGMPLGILLAASWINGLTVAEIAHEIEQSFEFLEGDWRDLPERQRSLRAVFEHSWSLLSEEERSAMRCFSMFRGGFTREAAQLVAEASLKTLNGLVNKFLLSRDENGRFDIHELLRQYSEKQLDQLPQERQLFQARYAAYYANYMDARWLLLRSAETKADADEIELEFDNVRAAWNIMVEQAYLPQIAMTARVLRYFLTIRVRYEEGIELFGRAITRLRTLPVSDARDIVLGETLQNLGYFYAANGVPDKGKRLAEESLKLLERHQATEIMLRAYITLCRSLNFLGEQHAMKRQLQRGISLAQQFGDPWYVGTLKFLHGVASVLLGEYEDAYRIGEEALTFLNKAHDSFYQGLCCGLVLGKTAFRLGRYQEAKQYYLRSVQCFEKFDDPFERAQSNRELSEVLALLHEYDAAKQAYQSSMGYYVKAGPQAYVLANLQSVSRLYEMQGQYIRAIELLALLINHPVAMPYDKPPAQVVLNSLRAKLSTQEFSLAYERGKTLDLNAVVAELLADK